MQIRGRSKTTTLAVKSTTYLGIDPEQLILRVSFFIDRTRLRDLARIGPTCSLAVDDSSSSYGLSISEKRFKALESLE